MKQLHIWEISRKDVRDRCKYCLKTFTKQQFRYKTQSLVFRFPNYCYTCRIKQKGRTLQELKINI